MQIPGCGNGWEVVSPLNEEFVVWKGLHVQSRWGFSSVLGVASPFF